MTCPTCGKKFDAARVGHCPYCTEAGTVLRSGMMKSSTILISAGETEAVYRSVKEVPPPLRRKLLKSTNGLNAATILIADRRGREEIQRALHDLPSRLQRRFINPLREEPAAIRQWLERRWVKVAIASLLSGASGLVIWLMFAHKWF